MRDNGGVTEPETPAETGDATPDAVAADAVAAEPKVQQYETTVRRAPKLPVFLIVGGALGAFVTLILTSMFTPDPNYGFAASYGYFLIYGIPFGVAVGAVIGLILDRRSRRRARTVTVEHERVD